MILSVLILFDKKEEGVGVGSNGVKIGVKKSLYIQIKYKVFRIELLILQNLLCLIHILITDSCRESKGF